MKYKSFLFIPVLITGLAGIGHSENQNKSNPATGENQAMKQMIIRTDDIGFCHSVNMAIKKILEEGVVTSISVIVNTPWLDEAVEILKQHPEVSIGVHLALNSEWKEYKWGPVMPYDKVQSLVDPFGKFFGSRREFMLHKPKVSEMAKEIRAQVDLAKKKGLNISYIDNHMSTAISTLEFQKEMEKLAKDYNIGISRYFGENYMQNTYFDPPEQKIAKGISYLDTMTTAGLYLLVCHVGEDDPELGAMTDLNSVGLKNMSKHRQGEMNLLCSPEFKTAIKAKGIQLIGYKELKEKGLDKMKRPFVSEKYDVVYKKAVENKN